MSGLDAPPSPDTRTSNGNVVPGTITAPKAGWLILSASIDGNGVINDNYRCHLTVDGVKVAGTRRTSVVHSAGAFPHTHHPEDNCSTTGVHQVTAGTHSFALTIVTRDTVDFGGANAFGPCSCPSTATATRHELADRSAVGQFESRFAASSNSPNMPMR